MPSARVAAETPCRPCTTWSLARQSTADKMWNKKSRRNLPQPHFPGILNIVLPHPPPKKKNCRFSWRSFLIHLMRGLLGLPDSSPQTACQLIQPFFQNLRSLSADSIQTYSDGADRNSTRQHRPSITLYATCHNNNNSYSSYKLQ